MGVDIELFEETLTSKHQNLRKHLESHLVFLSFLVQDDPKLKRRYEIFSNFQLIAQILWTSRYVYFLINTPDDPLNFYLSDANYMLGPARTPINLIFASINGVSICCVILWKLTLYIQKNNYHHWLKACEVFETECYRGIGKFTFELKILYFTGYIFWAAIWTVCIAQDVKLFSEAPTKYLFWGIFFFFYHAFDGCIAFFYMGETAFIFMLHVFVNSEYFLHLANSIDDEPLSSMVEKYFTSHIELIGLLDFSAQKNYFLFIGLVSVQVLLCYYIFFTDILLGIKIALTLILLAIHPVGITGPFVGGAYLQRQHENLIRQLFTLATRPGPLREKLNLLNVLEHSWDKTEVHILGDLKYCSQHYLLVLLETASTLLLLIANLNGSSQS